MFALAFAIGIFSYLIFLLGMVGLLYKPVLIGCSLVFWIGFLVLKQKELKMFLSGIKLRNVPPFFLLCLSLLFVQAAVNFIGVIGPEIGFDALWYHLTLPKLYLQYHSIFHIPGSILLYSDMPKLTEMLYTAVLAFGSDIFPKALHYSFGILSCIALYKVARKFFSPSLAILAPVIFYSNLVVGWESISAYIDLSWTFFALMTLWAFVEWTQEKKREWLIVMGLLAGLTFNTKLLAGGTAVLFGFFVFFSGIHNRPLVLRLQRILLYSLLAVIIPLPWFVFSFIHTGNPFYPLFSHLLPFSYFQLFNPIFFFSSFWHTFVFSPDPINPLYLATIPFLVVYRKKLWEENKLLFLLAIGGLIMWYITPQTGGGRFVIPYLPLFTLLVLLLLKHIPEGWRKVFILSVLLCAIISIGYRAIANEKFIPVILGKESKAQFLGRHLAFDLGDFYDTDGYFASHIRPTDRVLLYGFHNLYYVDFPYIHESWAQKGDIFNYVAVQGKGMPERFRYWNLIYFNNMTQVRLYSLPSSLWRY